MIKVSIIIPTLNEAERIEKLLLQLHQIQTAVPREIIVVDGGSRDQTVIKAQKYATVYQLKQPNRGQQLDFGAKHSQGELLWFLHADSQLDPNQDIFKMMLATMAGGKYSAGFLKLKFLEPGFFYRYLETISNWRAYLGWIFGDQGLFTTRENYEMVGGFLPVPLMEDWILSTRLHKLGKFHELSTLIYTSGRKFAGHEWRTHFAMQKIKLLFLLGVSPEKLAQRYYKR